MLAAYVWMLPRLALEMVQRAAKQFLQQSILALRREKELLLLRLPPIQGARTITAEEIQNIVQDSLPTVSYDTLAKLRQSVFIVKESRTDKKGIGHEVDIVLPLAIP
ncbi:hypothetical protein WJX72_011544 [[Myrmecia] bisecta]|uniref:Uncharacterized protein n=1 Tax=[Myrmecia] bisecta TaxID=41462 RepID=A0AAW1QA52_9CHLO